MYNIMILIFLLSVLYPIVPEETTLNDDSDYNSSESFSTTEYNIFENDSELCNSSTCLEKTTNAPILLHTSPSEVFMNYTSDFCLCDLQLKVCDLNCCCDEDCSYNDKKIFDHCEPIQKANIDKRECQYTHFEYVNFTMKKWNIYNNDLFCIVRKNVPPSQILPNKRVFETYFEASLEKVEKYDWPREISEAYSDHKNVFQSYTQGRPLWIIQNNSTWSYFSVYRSFISGGCEMSTQVSYLYNTKTKCIQKLHMKNMFVNTNYFNKLIFVAKPSLFNYTKFEDKLQTCPSPICLKVETEVCSSRLLSNCRIVNGSDIQFFCKREEKIVRCERVIDHLKFTFLHKGVEGIESIRLSLHLTDVTYDISVKEYTILQHTNVEFQWVQDSKNYSHLLSGNPGYLTSKPILLGTRLNNTIVRNSSLYYENFMVLPYEDLGICYIEENYFQPIEFGYDIFLMCKIRGMIQIPANVRVDKVCKNLQLEVFKYWRILSTQKGFVNRTFGQYGNSNVSDFNHWKDFLYEKDPQQILNGINGTLQNENSSITCNGLVFGMNMDIYHARVNSKSFVDQEKIIGITYQFNQYKSITHDLKNNRLEFAYEIDIQTKVKFWDITTRKLSKLIDSPTLNIKLPSDFFYPFVKVGNSLSRINCLSKISLGLLCVIILQYS